MFSNLEKKELQIIYEDYIVSKEEGKSCESFVVYAEQYRKQKKIGILISLSEAINIVSKIFLEEIAKRYFNQ